MKIERLSTMIEGEYCAVLIDGVSYHKEVSRTSKGLCIRVNKSILYEYELPLGEEVTI